MNIIDVYGLTKIYSGKRRKRTVVALDGLTLKVPQGEVFGILGAEGAGKTTLFRALVGLTRPDSGSITIAEKSPSDPRSRKSVGYFSENPVFPGHLTSRGLLQLTGKLIGMPRAEIELRTERLLKLLELDRWPDLKVKKFSRGLTSRVGLAQALISDPDILLLDEPLDGLDNTVKREINLILEKLRQQGKTILISSHFRSDVEHLADRIGVMKKGRIVRIVDIRTLKDERCMFEIIANIGHNVIDVPKEIGSKIKVTTSSMIVEVVDPDKINVVIDQIRLKGLSIKSVSRLNTDLEQSLYTGVEDLVEVRF